MSEEEMRTAYVIEVEIPYEPGWVVGVFLSKEKALVALDELSKDHDACYDFVLNEYELNPKSLKLN